MCVMGNISVAIIRNFMVTHKNICKHCLSLLGVTNHVIIKYCLTKNYVLIDLNCNIKLATKDYFWNFLV